MAQDVSILPKCVQLAATQGIAAVDCQQSFACACKSFVFLNSLEIAILSSCGPTDQALAFSSARQYCRKVNRQLEENRRTAILAVVILFAILALTSVFLRFLSRRLANAQLGWDDWSILAALLFDLVVDGLALAGLHWSESKHQFMVDPGLTQMSRKLQLSTFWMSTIANTFVRLSIFALYLRIFNTLPVFKKILRASGVIVVLLAFLFMLLYTLQCQPVAYFWNKSIQRAHCLDETAIYVAYSAVDTATGVWALVLPIPIISHLQTDIRRKVVLIALFSIGTFACVTAALRIPFVLQIDTNDVGWSLVPFTIWATIEVNMAVISVCLPTLAPLFQSWLPRFFLTVRSKSGPKSHTKLPDDQTRIYTGGRSVKSNDAWASAGRTENGAKEQVAGRDDEEIWPMSVIGVTKEVNVETEGSVASNQRINEV